MGSGFLEMAQKLPENEQSMPQLMSFFRSLPTRRKILKTQLWSDYAYLYFRAFILAQIGADAYTAKGNIKSQRNTLATNSYTAKPSLQCTKKF